jgi:D-alanyl-D-alanine carboxypeptidase
MRRSKRKNGCASVVLIIFLIALVAIVFVLVKSTFTGNEQNKPPLNTSISSPTLTPNPSQTETSNTANTENVLVLVNKDNKLPDDYEVTLTTIESEKVASILKDDLNEMRKAAEKENIYLYIRSAYRTHEEQEKTFNNAVSGYVNQGNSQSVAVERAEQVAARPGYSEHQTGLAVDFSYGAYAERQAVMWDWLSKNAYKYGFILRYPENKEHITGYTFEPWHYRYVGKEHAKVIYDNGFLFEEYLYSLN